MLPSVANPTSLPSFTAVYHNADQLREQHTADASMANGTIAQIVIDRPEDSAGRFCSCRVNYFIPVR